MPQRKDTPAARAALARRRQRAAQTLRNPQTSTESTSTDVSSQAETKTKKISTTSILSRNSQSVSKVVTSNDESDVATRTVPMGVGLPSTNTSVDHQGDAMDKTTADNLNNRNVSSKNLGQAVDEMTKAEEQLSAIDMSLDKSYSIDTRLSATSEKLHNHPQHRLINCDVRTETELRFASNSTTVGEYNIETVLQDIATSGDKLQPLSPTIVIDQNILSQKMEDEIQQQKIHQEQHGQFFSHSPEKYERISNFGFVERTSPQPLVKDRRDLIRYESSLQSREIMMSASIGSVPAKNNVESISTIGEFESSTELQLPSLESFSPVHVIPVINDSTTDHEKKLIPDKISNSTDVNLESNNMKTNDKNDNVQQQGKYKLPSSSLPTSRQVSYRKGIAKSIQNQNSKNTIGMNSQSTVKNDTDSTMKKKSSKTSKIAISSDSLYEGAIVGRRSPTRVSRIPSPTKINSTARQLLPRRNGSPKRTTSPEKRLSPRRFHLPLNDSNGSPYSAPKYEQHPPKHKPVVSTPNRTKFDTSQAQSNKLKSNFKSISYNTNRHVASTLSTSSTEPNTVSQFDKLQRSTVVLGSNSSSTNEIDHHALQAPNQAQKGENLSENPMDLSFMTDGVSIPGAEQPQRQNIEDLVMQSRNLEGETAMATKLMRSSTTLSYQNDRLIETDEKIERKINSRFFIRDHTHSNLNDIEHYHISVDENDARHLNVPPRSTQYPVQKSSSKNETSFNKSYTKKSQYSKSVEGYNQNITQEHNDFHDVDAACLHSGDFIMLRSCGAYATLQKEMGEGLCKFNGPCLGKDEEVLKVVNIADNGFSPLRYGDTVRLQSMAIKNENFLGIRRIRTDVNEIDKIGFFSDGDKNSSCWIIHSVIPGKSILIGRAAVAGKNSIHDNTAIIRSGDSILLVNMFNGGLLSIRDGVAVLLTDSYNPNRLSFSNNPSLLGRLERHDRLEPSLSDTFELLKFFIPPSPIWVRASGMGGRIFLNGSYLSEPLRNQNESIIVDTNLSLMAKENILVDEVVGSFLGLEGLYIKMKETKERSKTNNCKFQLLDGADITFDLVLRNLVEQILPLSSSYVCVRNFIGLHYPGYEYGRVMQAFCEGLDSFLQQFVSFVAQVEHRIRNPPSTGALTLKNIHFEITPLLHSMSILEHATKAVYNKKGGALINALRSLEKKVYMGDTVAKDLLGTLLDQTSVPYSEMLSIWLESGRVHDPYEEFMITKAYDGKNEVELDGDTWTKLFTINEEHVIEGIVGNEKTKNTILVTGKYWNAVRACLLNTASSRETKSRPLEVKKFQFQSDFSGISTYIYSMYGNASEKLMNILREGFHLKEVLQMMKRYFLLDKGDFLVSFLEASAEELTKPVEEVSIGRVQHYLGISVQCTEFEREDDKDPSLDLNRRNRCKLSATNLRCKLSKQDFVSSLDSLNGGIEDRVINTPSRRKYGSQKQGATGFEFFEIEFPRIPFPISLILSPTSMDSYKLLFRHLFFTKHVERRLVDVWSDHQVLKKLDSLRGLLGPTFLLRQRMLYFVQNLMSYVTFEVVESNWQEMLSLIDVPDDTMPGYKEHTVEDLLNIHEDFLQKTLNACLLTNPILIRSLMKLLNTCLLFTDQMKRFMNTTKIYDDQFNIAAEKRGAVQRKINERIASESIPRDRKKLQKSMLLVKEERDILLQRQTRRVGREICSESYMRMINRFEEVFGNDLSAFFTHLNNHTSSGVVTNLGIRLDWNGYITKKVSIP